MSRDDRHTAVAMSLREALERGRQAGLLRLRQRLDLPDSLGLPLLPAVPPVTDAMETLPAAWLQLSEVPRVGLGVFARRPIAAGTLLGQYTGRALRRAPTHSPSQYLLQVPPPYPYVIDAALEDHSSLLLPFIVPRMPPPHNVLSVHEQQSNWTRYINGVGGLLPGQPQNLDFIEGTRLARSLSVLGGAAGPPVRLLPARMYAVTTRPIDVGDQLLANYGRAFFSVDTARVRVLERHEVPPPELQQAMARVMGLAVLPAAYDRMLDGLGYLVRLLVDDDQGDVVAFLVALMPGRLIWDLQVVGQLQNQQQLRQILLQDAADALRGSLFTAAVLEVPANRAAIVFTGAGGATKPSSQQVLVAARQLGFVPDTRAGRQPERAFIHWLPPLRWLVAARPNEFGNVDAEEWALDVLQTLRPNLLVLARVPGREYQVVVLQVGKHGRRVAALLLSADGRTLHVAQLALDAVYARQRRQLLYWELLDAFEDHAPPGAAIAVHADRGTTFEQTLRTAAYRLRPGQENVFELRKFVPTTR